MSEIQQDEVTMEDIIAWNAASEELARAKNVEMLLRNRVFKGKFPAPVEGTNSVPLLNDYVLKATYKMNRTVELEAISTLADDLREAGINTTELIKYKPELDVKAYKALNADQRQVSDMCLTVKPGTPSLEIVLPKRASKSVHANELPQV